ncbi:MAG: hypothetical protein NW200_03635 [Hyphomonadaceae bacterium]|nr:hypothetical protein [Hyphomonadaceae bacterium]
MKRDDDLFIGWAPPLARTRRGFLAGAAAATAAGAGVAAALAMAQGPPGDGRWAQGDVREWTGLLERAPYPALRTRALDAAGGVRTAFLAGQGKVAVARRLPDGLSGAVTVRASLIARGRHAMLAAVDDADWIRPAAEDAGALAAPAAADLGEATLIGEILDAKCWFGAMRPGYGKTHKSCAALCARGGLPLAFCARAACRDGGDAPLFLDPGGAAHDGAILPWVADPVMARGRLVQVGDVLQFRVARSAIQRL